MWAVAALLVPVSLFGQQSTIAPTENQQVLVGSDGQPVGTIRGILIGQDGQPAKGIGVTAVWLCPDGCLNPERQTLTDDSGRFGFEHVALGEYAVFPDDVEAGYGPKLLADGARYGEAAELTHEHKDAELRLTLPRKAGFLEVHLTDQSTGDSISTVSVKIALVESPNRAGFQTSFEESNCTQNSRYICTVLIPPDEQVFVQVSSPGYDGWDKSGGTGTVRSVRLGSGDRVTWNIPLEPDLRWRALHQMTWPPPKPK